MPVPAAYPCMLAFAVFSLSACGASTTSDPGTASGASATTSSATRTVVADEFIRLASRADEEYFPQALVKGRLTMEASCLLVDNLVAVWTADFEWDPEARTVTWPQGSANVGDRVLLGGGAQPPGSEESDRLISPEGVEAIQRCVAVTDAERWTYLTPR